MPRHNNVSNLVINNKCVFEKVFINASILFIYYALKNALKKRFLSASCDLKPLILAVLCVWHNLWEADNAAFWLARELSWSSFEVKYTVVKTYISTVLAQVDFGLHSITIAVFLLNIWSHKNKKCLSKKLNKNYFMLTKILETITNCICMVHLFIEWLIPKMPSIWCNSGRYWTCVKNQYMYSNCSTDSSG